MGVFRNILHTLSGIWDDVKKIKSLQDPTIVEKAKRYDEMSEALKDVLFSVTKIYEKVDDNGDTDVFIEYGKETKKIKIRPNEDDEYDPFIIAMNKLNLISFDDMLRIQEAVKRNKLL